MEKLTLTKPLTFGNKTIEALTFRDYTLAEDYLAFDTRGGVAQNIALIASLTGQDEAVIRKLSGRDYKAAYRIADKLLAADDEAFGDVATEKKPSES
jgi:hypothetical protein